MRNGSSGSGSGSSGSGGSSSGSGGSSSSGGSSGSGSGGNNQSVNPQPSQNDIGYDASLAKAKAMAGADAIFMNSTDGGDCRIFYFKKSMPDSGQSNYTTDTFAIAVDKATGTTSLY